MHSRIEYDNYSTTPETLRHLRSSDSRLVTFGMAPKRRGGPTKRAADALILARSDEEPRTSGQTGRAMRRLRSTNSTTFAELHRWHFSRQAELHGNCFYDNNCEPVEVIEAQIRETSEFIQACQEQADAS